MTTDELKLFKSKNPKEYIENSLRVKLTSGRKAFITKQWLEKHKKFTVEDIKYARNRNPYWKSRKMEGSLERNLQRHQEHDYTYQGAVEWDEDLVKEFIEMNKKDRSGKYIHRDYELAERFNTTIPGIQHYRRKYNLTLKIMERQNVKPTLKRIYGYVIQSEKILRGMLKGRRRR